MSGLPADRNESRRDNEQQGACEGGLKIELERNRLWLGMIFVFLSGIFFGYLLASF